MNDQIASLLQDQVLLKLLMAFILGGAIGLEREFKGRAAGLRTHVLVALGSTILIIAARHSGEVTTEPGVARLVIDPSRMAAGIVTGIGFLGAGAILRMGDLVRGITTAACIWFVAAVGVVIGNGMYAIGVLTTAIALVVLVLFNIIERKIPVVLYRSLLVTVPSDQRHVFTIWARELFDRNNVRLFETLTHVDAANGMTEITFRIRARGGFSPRDLVDEISQRPEVRSVDIEPI